jgi:hypothetical protein
VSGGHGLLVAAIDEQFRLTPYKYAMRPPLANDLFTIIDERWRGSQDFCGKIRRGSRAL